MGARLQAHPERQSAAQSSAQTLCTHMHASLVRTDGVQCEGRQRVATESGNGAEGRREKRQMETRPRKPKTSTQTNVCFSLMLITGTNADGNPQIVPARTSSLAP